MDSDNNLNDLECQYDSGSGDNVSNNTINNDNLSPTDAVNAQNNNNNLNVGYSNLALNSNFRADEENLRRSSRSRNILDYSKLENDSDDIEQQIIEENSIDENKTHSVSKNTDEEKMSDEDKVSEEEKPVVQKRGRGRPRINRDAIRNKPSLSSPKIFAIRERSSRRRASNMSSLIAAEAIYRSDEDDDQFYEDEDDEEDDDDDKDSLTEQVRVVLTPFVEKFLMRRHQIFSNIPIKSHDGLTRDKKSSTEQPNHEFISDNPNHEFISDNPNQNEIDNLGRKRLPRGKIPYEYLVKYQNQSYSHCKWITVDDIENDPDPKVRIKYQRYIQRLEQKGADNASGTYVEDAPELQYIDGEIDRIVDCTDVFRALYPMKAAEIGRNEWYIYCLKIIDALVCFDRKGIKYGVPFLRPVDPGADGASDYYSVITKPMDFTTVQTKLYLRIYSQPQEFWIDVQQIFNNCFMYNFKDSDIFVQGKLMKALFDKLYGEWALLSRQTQEDLVKRKGDETPEEYLDDSTITIEKGIQHITFRDLLALPKRPIMYFCKWRHLSFSDLTWEHEVDIVDTSKILQFHRYIRVPDYIVSPHNGPAAIAYDLYKRMISETYTYIRHTYSWMNHRFGLRLNPPQAPSYVPSGTNTGDSDSEDDTHAPYSKRKGKSRYSIRTYVPTTFSNLPHLTSAMSIFNHHQHQSHYYNPNHLNSNIQLNNQGSNELNPNTIMATQKLLQMVLSNNPNVTSALNTAMSNPSIANLVTKLLQGVKSGTISIGEGNTTLQNFLKHAKSQSLSVDKPDNILDNTEDVSMKTENTDANITVSLNDIQNYTESKKCDNDAFETTYSEGVVNDSTLDNNESKLDPMTNLLDNSIDNSITVNDTDMFFVDSIIPKESNCDGHQFMYKNKCFDINVNVVSNYSDYEALNEHVFIYNHDNNSFSSAVSSNVDLCDGLVEDEVAGNLNSDLSIEENNDNKLNDGNPNDTVTNSNINIPPDTSENINQVNLINTHETEKSLNKNMGLASLSANNQISKLYAEQRRPAPPSSGVSRHYPVSPLFKNGYQLFDYQLSGLNWLLQLWSEGRNGILADEMGLGKTMQTMAFIWHLVYKERYRGPFLIVAPLSTLDHWKRTFEDWTDLNVVTYYDEGGRSGRDLLRHFEWYHQCLQFDMKGRGRTSYNKIYSNGYTNEPRLVKTQYYKFHVLLTSYEILLADADILCTMPWQFVVIDEAHRLKNRGAKTLQVFKSIACRNILLLSGTPVQNNTEELWPLLNYIEPIKFASLEAFQQEFGDLQTSLQVSLLHDLLKPHLLRRVKEDVMKEIPPLEETIIDVELTTAQKAYYRAIFERNRAFLCKNVGKKIVGNIPSLMNVEVELRKCCNHPFQVVGVEERELVMCKTNQERYRKMVELSGKMVLLEKLLPKLKSEGHKVLIFSQFVQTLSILEELIQNHGWGYERLDGSIRGSDRNAAITRFNDSELSKFIFLLSTRAGGLGINLTSADTVIIFDSDWNPQNDVQATARAHRIGQTRDVKVYRLITARTYEAEMFERASRKLGLNTAVFHKGAFKEENGGIGTSGEPNKQEIEDLLKHGAYYLLEGSEASRQFQESDIDEILSKNSRLVRYQLSGKNSSFSKTSFRSDNALPDLDVNDPDFWNKVLGDTSVSSFLIQLQSGSVIKDDESRDKFLNDLSDAVDGAAALDNIDPLIEALVQITNMREFSELQRQKADDLLAKVQEIVRKLQPNDDEEEDDDDDNIDDTKQKRRRSTRVRDFGNYDPYIFDDFLDDPKIKKGKGKKKKNVSSDDDDPKDEPFIPKGTKQKLKLNKVKIRNKVDNESKSSRKKLDSSNYSPSSKKRARRESKVTVVEQDSSEGIDSAN